MILNKISDRSDISSLTAVQPATRYSGHSCMLHVCKEGGASAAAAQTASSTTRGPAESWEMHSTERT